MVWFTKCNSWGNRAEVSIQSRCLPPNESCGNLTSLSLWTKLNWVDLVRLDGWLSFGPFLMVILYPLAAILSKRLNPQPPNYRISGHSCPNTFNGPNTCLTRSEHVQAWQLRLWLTECPAFQHKAGLVSYNFPDVTSAVMGWAVHAIHTLLIIIIVALFRCCRSEQRSALTAATANPARTLILRYMFCATPVRI